MSKSLRDFKILNYGIVIILSIFLIFVFSGCVQKSSSEASDIFAQKPFIVATFNPIGDVVSAVAGDLATVDLLVPMGAEPHDFDPSPQDIRKLSAADLVFANGAGLDSWIDELVVASGNVDVAVIRFDSFVQLLTHEDDSHDESASEETVEEEHVEGSYDPHFWLSPKNMIVLATQAAKELSRVDPSNAAQYDANLQAYVARLTKLDVDVSTMFASCESKEFIILHGFLGYFCESYGCEQVGVQGISPESDLTPKQLALAIDLAKEHNITAVVSEQGASDKTERAIASAIGGNLISISPFERKAVDDKRDYISTMESNVQAFKSALKCR